MEKKHAPPLIVSTWPFGKAGNDVALETIKNRGSTLDAVERGIRQVEASGNTSVGLTGLPNADGYQQLDACIMYGPGHRAGSVAALEGIQHPISVARRVMEKTKHVMLAGAGAQKFALAEGFELVKPGGSPASNSAAPVPKPGPHNHDTIAMLVLGADGTVSGGCSTSGLAGKLAGRVGDSPILGSGLYVDNQVGGAGATGVGENVMRYCGSFLVVEYMRQGASPEEACLETIRRIAKMDPLGFNLSISFVALDKKGRYGAAGSATGFQYSVTTLDFSEVMTGAGASDQPVGPVGGNRI
jgi:N4-(beta-N-acetylglucosaminyl)-L-asparaginase